MTRDAGNRDRDRDKNRDMNEDMNRDMDSSGVRRGGRSRGRRGAQLCVMALAAGLALLSSGCGAGDGPQVVAEKTAAASEPGSKTGDVAAGEAMTGEAAAKSTGVRSMVQAPERYQVSVEGSNMTLIADAPVEVPDVERVTIKKVTDVTYTEDEYEKLRSYTAKKLGVTWKEPAVQKLSEGVSFYNSECAERDDLTVQWYSAKIDGDQTADNDARNNSMSMRGGSAYRYMLAKKDFPDEFAGELATGELLKKLGAEAEQIKADMGRDDMKLQAASWILGYYESIGENPQAVPMAEYIFTREVDGIPALYGVAPPPYSISYQNDEYMRVLLDRDGKLVALGSFRKQQITDGTKEEQFLLPFSEISQVLEQVLQNSHLGFGTFTSLPGSDLNYEFRINSVKLGYRSIFERQNGRENTVGKMIPVWDFYGEVKVSGKLGGEVNAVETLNSPSQVLLTVNAMDGTVITD